MTRRQYDHWEHRLLAQDVSGNTHGICKSAESLSTQAKRIGQQNVDATIAKILASTPVARQAYMQDVLHKITQA